MEFIWYYPILIELKTSLKTLLCVCVKRIKQPDCLIFVITIEINMSDDSFDEKTINKIIPQIFEKKRNTIDSATITSKLQASMNQISFLATQSVIDERSSLDNIIETIDKVNNTLSTITPKNMKRIYEVCKSTNAILDTWVDIQSQAMYLNKMMKNTRYTEHLEALEKGHDIIGERVEEINRLKDELSSLRGQQTPKKIDKISSSSTMGRLQRRVANTKNQRISRLANSNIQNSISKVSQNRNLSSIPRVSSNRITKPTESSLRKTFQR